MTDVRTKSLDELYEYGAQLRSEFAEMHTGERNDETGIRTRALIDEVHSLDAQITLAELEDRRSSGRLASTSGGFRSMAGGEIRSIGEMIVADESIMRWAAEGGTQRPGGGASEGPVLDIDKAGTMSQMLTRGILALSGPDSGIRAPGVAEWAAGGPPSFDTTGVGNLLPVGQPIPPVPRQAKLYLRDLLPSMTTTLAQIPYVKEVTPTAFELGASAVAEGGTKPNATLDFVGAKADPTVLATTLVISKQLFEDAAAVVQYINQRLPYLVKFKEDWEFLNGSGTWPDIQGILNAGPQTQAATSGEMAITLGNAFALVELADGAPTFVVMQPQDAWSMFTKRAAGGAGTFDAGTPFSALPLTVWGVPTYRTRAISKGQALVADGERGAMIIDRESVNIQTYRERYAEVNQVLLVCEERVGLAIWRPDLFVNTALS